MGLNNSKKIEISPKNNFLVDRRYDKPLEKVGSFPIGTSLGTPLNGQKGKYIVEDKVNERFLLVDQINGTTETLPIPYDTASNIKYIITQTKIVKFRIYEHSYAPDNVTEIYDIKTGVKQSIDTKAQLKSLNSGFYKLIGGAYLSFATDGKYIYGYFEGNYQDSTNLNSALFRLDPEALKWEFMCKPDGGSTKDESMFYYKGKIYFPWKDSTKQLSVVDVETRKYASYQVGTSRTVTSAFFVNDKLYLVGSGSFVSFIDLNNLSVTSPTTIPNSLKPTGNIDFDGKERFVIGNDFYDLIDLSGKVFTATEDTLATLFKGEVELLDENDEVLEKFTGSNTTTVILKKGYSLRYVTGVRVVLIEKLN